MEEEFPRFNSKLYRGCFDVSHNFHEIDLLRMAEHVDDLFRNFINDKLGRGRPRDFININIQHNDLAQGINISSRIANFNVEEFANRIFKTTQSNAEWLATGKFTVEVIITKARHGSGFPSTNSLPPQTPCEAVQSRRCLVEAKNSSTGGDANACGYWSIALGKSLYQKLTKTQRDTWIRNKNNCVQKAARKFCQEARLNYSEPFSTETWQIAANALAPEYQLIIVDGSTTKYQKLFEGPEASRRIYLFLENNHYSLITKIATLFKRDYFCHKCWVGWKQDGRHSCKAHCQACRQPGSCTLVAGEEPSTCRACNRQFFGTKCFERHTAHHICKAWKKCNSCEAEYQARFGHECNKVYCDRCKIHEEPPHHCFLAKKDLEKLQEQDSKLKIIVSFDIESELKPIQNDLYEHIPNLLCAQVSCDNCYDMEKYSVKYACDLCEQTKKTFSGYNCIKNFGDYLYKDLAKKATAKGGRVYVFAHNFQRYDGHFIFRDLYERGFDSIDLTQMGMKLLRLDVGNIRFVDSLSFFQLPLSKLPSAFGFNQMVKGDFPHLFNTPQNSSYIGSWPAKKFYDYEKKSARE